MSDYWITFTLLSDATFGRGDGVAGLIDREVEHDQYGLPFLRGRTLKGLLCEEADNILYALSGGEAVNVSHKWATARQVLFGRPGSQQGSAALVRYGHAQLPAALRETVIRSFALAGTTLTRADVLASLTGIRRQTAIDENGVPTTGSLRAMRIILRQTPFRAQLRTEAPLADEALALLAATVLAFRRAGTGRNRGRGRLEADLLDGKQKSILWHYYDKFVEEDRHEGA